MSNGDRFIRGCYKGATINYQIMETGIFNKDCLEVLRLLPEESVDCCVTDCPYKIVQGGCSTHISEYEPRGCLSKRKLYSQKTANINDIRAGRLFKYNEIEFSEWLPDLYRVMKNGTHTYIMISPRRLKELQTEAEKAGFEFQNLLVWDKGNAIMNKYYMNAYELVLMLRKGGARDINDLGASNIIKIPNVRDKEHPTQKPVSLMELLISNSTQPGELVIDPFMGSGSTCVAAKRIGREYIGIEIDKEYYDIAERRLTEEIKQIRFDI